MVEHSRMRWYNPKLKSFEWREVPESDQEAFSLLDSCPGCEEYDEVYRKWRELGAGIMVALIRAGDVAKEKGEKDATV